MCLAARISALVIGEAGALFGLWSSLTTFFLILGSLIFEGSLPSTPFIVIDGTIVLFSLLAFVAAIVALMYPRAATYMLAVSTLGVLVFGYMQVPDATLPEGFTPVPFYYWAITATPILLVATVLAFFGREPATNRDTLEG